MDHLDREIQTGAAMQYNDTIKIIHMHQSIDTHTKDKEAHTNDKEDK